MLEFFYQISDYQVLKKYSDTWYKELRRNTYIILVGKYEGKIDRPRQISEGDIKMNHKESSRNRVQEYGLDLSCA
jgi:hypothetical protein